MFWPKITEIIVAGVTISTICCHDIALPGGNAACCAKYVYVVEGMCCPSENPRIIFPRDKENGLKRDLIEMQCKTVISNCWLVLHNVNWIFVLDRVLLGQ